jgi:hypothetical protein
MGLVLLQADVEDERDTTEVPFLTTVLLEYADPIQPLLGSGLDPVTGQPAAGNAGAAGGAANPFGLPAAGWGGAGAGGGF